MKARVLVTGGAGYIGSVLTRELLGAGHAVTVLDNFMYGQTTLLENCWNDDFRIIRGDVRDKETVKAALTGVSYIIHLAALVGAPLCDKDPAAAVAVNLEATKSLLTLKEKGQKILFPCTNSGYGIGQAGKYCTEETPLKPISLYGKTKVEAERAILDSKDSISFRLATVFGASPRMRLDLLVNSFVYKAVTDGYLVVYQGRFNRNYIHIRDVARAFLFGIEKFDALKDNVYNVGLSDANISKLELCAAIKKHIPDFYYVEGAVGEDKDKRDYIVSNAKIEAKGFKPLFSLDFGIEELMKAYRILGTATNPTLSNV